MPTSSNATQLEALLVPADFSDGSDISEAAYWELYYEGTNYEWNDGRLEEKPVSDQLTWLISFWFMGLLQRFLALNPIADTTGLDFGSRLVLPDKVTIRKPDLGVIRRDNPIAIQPLDKSYKGVYDLCVEALSDSNATNRNRDLVTKKAEYAAAGVREYFILHHKQRYQAFYTLTAQGVYAPIVPENGVIYSKVLPGFGFRITDLNLRPDIDGLRNDPLYQTFVAPEWKAAEKRAEAEVLLRKQAEQAQRQAEQNKRKAEEACQAAEQYAQRLAEQLRALGIDPDAS